MSLPFRSAHWSCCNRLHIVPALFVAALAVCAVPRGAHAWDDGYGYGGHRGHHKHHKHHGHHEYDDGGWYAYGPPVVVYRRPPCGYRQAPPVYYVPAPRYGYGHRPRVNVQLGVGWDFP